MKNKDADHIILGMVLFVISAMVIIVILISMGYIHVNLGSITFPKPIYPPQFTPLLPNP